MSKYLHDARNIVRKAGRKVRDLLVETRIEREKPNDDVVTNGDLLSEKIILDFITKSYPEHGYNSEEQGCFHDDAEFIWILDPIDGSKYYAKHAPFYSISLALQHRGQVVLGIVYLPETDQMFSAAKGEGSWLNGKRIQCSENILIDELTVCAEIPNKNMDQEARTWALGGLAKLIEKTRRVRILGVGSISICMCAMGVFEAYVNLSGSSKIYDFAAAGLILEEANGEFSPEGKMILGGRNNVVRTIKHLLAG